MLDLAKLEPGMHVLDLATGRGEPAIPATRRVLPNGTVLGIDIDQSVLQLARDRADLEGITNLSLAVADMQSPESLNQTDFDVAFSRWGLMYLRRPEQALLAVRRMLTEGGRLVIAVWVDPENATFIELPRASLAKIVSVPPVDYDIPGTFYYDDAKRLSAHLETAGFSIEHAENIEVDVMEVKSDKELIDWARTFGMSRLLQGVSIENQNAWERELISDATRLRRRDGSIRLGGTSRIIVAA